LIACTFVSNPLKRILPDTIFIDTPIDCGAASAAPAHMLD